MKQIRHELIYEVYESASELQPNDFDLLEKAKSAISGSYAPYSRFHVGAAVKLANEQIFTGSNQENMSFPAGLCAERVAIFAAASSCPDVPVSALAISAFAEAFEVSEPVLPCGMCRQAVMEYEMKWNQKIRVILGGHSGRVFVFDGMENLLPLAFIEKGLVKA